MSAYLDRLSKQGTTGHGNLSESRVSRKMGSRLQPASGALAGAKSDALMKGVKYNFRIESKSTSNLTMAIDIDWLTKIGREALTSNSIPLVTISFVLPGTGVARMGKNSDWVMMPLVNFQELQEAAERNAE